jgi:LPLT family lysophospholipid transporter-like MFS transporter
MKTTRNYPLLLSSQFLSAFGDNVILAVILGQLTFLHQQNQISTDELRTYNALYTCILFIPYIVLAPLAGFLNDRYAKTTWLLGGNFIKLVGTLVAALSVWWGYQWQALGYFIVGIGACIYSPAKYGILPEVLPTERLVKANGTVEVLTLLAILTGPLTGAILIDRFSERFNGANAVLACYSVLLVIFGISLVLNLFMSKTPHNPDIRLRTSVKEFSDNFGALIRSSRLIRIILGTGVFWISGAVLKMNFQPWGLNVLGFTNNTQIAKLGLWLGLGVMAGSVLAGQLHKVGDLKATRLYGCLLAAFVAGLSLITKGSHSVPFLILIGMSAGLFLIPLNAALQAESHQDKLGKTIATQNFVDNVGMVLGGAYVMIGIQAGLSPQGIFIGLAGLIGLAMLWLKIPQRTNSDTATT